MTPTSSFLKGIFLPLFLWIAFTPWSAELDLKISHFFYQTGSFSTYPLWTWFYTYGLWPAWILAGLACLGLGLSAFNAYRHWCRPCLFLILTLALGSGLIIHACLKDHWGRPRPRQTIEFGGAQPFRPYYQPHFWHQPEPSKSFACGHGSLGFYFFALSALGAFYQRRRVYYLGLGLAWGLGIGLSLARIAQGGHFLSDTLASALIMWLTTWILAYVLLKQNMSRGTNERVNT